ncbi:JAB domain-containing protein [Sorangium sp. So ce1182]|uniref:JAB domain-containing protein n=1 Tax=Sorangium sp. So ce1182 TaxID=3133334 RepID=UPI003F648CA4
MSDAADSSPAPAATLVDVPTAPEATLVDLVLGIPGAASRVLAMHGLLELGRLTPHALAQRTELALHDAQRLLAALELGRRVHAARSRRTRRLRSPRDIARFFEPMLAHLVHEELWMAALDVHHRVRGVRMLSRGGLGGTLVEQADVLRAALEMAATSFVLCHNHPSGDPKPTDEDVFLTNAVEHAAHLIGIPLADHVIVTPAGRFSSVFRR